ncbi:MAG TPA: sialidase family protein, partial [Egibacteraceae bacterium]|nr:sialidase family protein [Egibacteraceae bacterium]
MDSTEQRLRELFDGSFWDDRPPAHLWEATARQVRRRVARRRVTTAISAMGAMVIAAVALPGALQRLGEYEIRFAQTPQASPSADPQSAIGPAADDPAAAAGPSHALSALHAIGAARSGLVAVGVDSEGLAGVWTSEDGAAWQPAHPPPPIMFDGLEGEALEMAAVASDGEAPLLAVAGGSAAPRIWRSSDGATWTRVDQAIAAFEDARVMDVAAGGPGFVAVGFSGDIGDESLQAAAWTSSDGIAWERVPDDEDQFDGDVMEQVVAGGPGLVAVGSDDKGSHVWTSDDGRSWKRGRPHVESEDGLLLQVSALASDGREVVAVARSEGSELFFLRYVSGFDWKDARLDPLLFEGAEIHGLANLDGRLVMIGRDRQGAAVWESDDGSEWTRMLEAPGAVRGASASEQPPFPDSSAQMERGDSAFGVYLAVAYERDAPALEIAEKRASEAGFVAVRGDVNCDRGVAEALGFDESRDYIGVR